MNSKPYNVVLLPEARIAENAIELSKKLAPFGVHFTLDGRNFFPHVSLYMLQLDEAGLQKATELVTTIAQENSSMALLSSEYRNEDAYIDIEYTKSPELVALQEKVIDLLNPIRDGLREKDKVRLADATGETRDNLIKYGYRSIGNLFAPHLTFTRFIDPQENLSTQSFPPKEVFDGTYKALGIFELGDDGTCVREVTSWKLI